MGLFFGKYMQIIFCDMNRAITGALQTTFKGVDGVRFYTGDITAVIGDALVSPANSYGWMNGGIDQVYLNMYGYQLQCRLQQKIADIFDGFMPIGKATWIHAMGFGPHLPKYLISAPTMEIPGNVSETRNAYLAFLAALRVTKTIPVNTLICPGLCSLTGSMAPGVMAKQMREAYEVFITEKP